MFHVFTIEKEVDSLNEKKKKKKKLSWFTLFFIIMMLTISESINLYFFYV